MSEFLQNLRASWVMFLIAEVFMLAIGAVAFAFTIFVKGVWKP